MEIIQIVNEAARSQANALEISDLSVRRMLNFTLNSIPTKLKLYKNRLKIIRLVAGVAAKKFFDSSSSIVYQPERSSLKACHFLKSTDQNAISYTLYLCKKLWVF